MNKPASSRILQTATVNTTSASSGILQRKCATCGTHTVAGDKCDECKKGALQRKSSNNSAQTEAPPVVHEVLNSSGQPLNESTRAFFEPRFGYDFSRIPVSSASPQLSPSSLKIGEPADVYEQEADRVADFVMRKAKHDDQTSSTNEREGGRFDLSQVRVHTDERAAASARAVNALAYTVGNNIVFDAGQFAPETQAGRRLIAHELTHVMQQSAPALRRQVRIDGGKKRVNEAAYATGAKKAVGSKRLVSALIADPVHRVFSNVAELEAYANGTTDYIGDVVTRSAKTFWYRLPNNQVTVLGEQHNQMEGNVEDVVIGLQTSRFMYEPFNELTLVPVMSGAFTGTKSRLEQLGNKERLAGRVDRKKFNPDLENIVIKALTGASIARNQFISGSPATMTPAEKKTWGSRPTSGDYSFGERIALYLSMGIHLASDNAKQSFGPENFVESPFVKSGRKLKEFYLANQAVLDQFMNTKDGDELIGIYELTAPNNFKNLDVIKQFTLVLHEYASRYIAQLGVQSGNKTLEAQGDALEGNQGAKVDDLSPAREEIMWEKIKKATAGGYLIVGMGNAHRQNLAARLTAAKIPHEEVETSLKAQKTAVDAGWTA